MSPEAKAKDTSVAAKGYSVTQPGAQGWSTHHRPATMVCCVLGGSGGSTARPRSGRPRWDRGGWRGLAGSGEGGGVQGWCRRKQPGFPGHVPCPDHVLRGGKPRRQTSAAATRRSAWSRSRSRPRGVRDRPSRGGGPGSASAPPSETGREVIVRVRAARRPGCRRRRSCLCRLRAAGPSARSPALVLRVAGRGYPRAGCN